MYELLVIGGGPGGYNAATRAAAAFGKGAVGVVEERALGGVCLNEGCVPTKTYLYSAKIYDYAKHSDAYGVTFTGAAIDHKKVNERKNRVVKQLVGGVQAQLKRAGVEVTYAKAEIKGREAGTFKVEATAADGTKTMLEAKRLLICTGSEAVLPPIDGLKDSLANGFAWTNRELLDATELPKTLVVVGGGVIGLEMASYMNSVGTKVYVVEMLDHIAGPTDREISGLLKKEYTERGVEFILGARVTAIKDGKVAYEMDGKTTEIPCDKVLVSIGRRARTAGIGLESIGVKTERGAIVTDEYAKTNVPGVWAAGDVNGKSMLAHTAYREGEVAVDNMQGGKDYIDYLAIPSVIYTNPEVAAVGETTESAKEKNLNCKIKTVSLLYSGRYVAENENGKGILKLVLDAEHETVLGVHIIGSYASEMIYGAAMMVAKRMRAADVKKMVFPHPTVCEVIREGVF